MRHRPVTRPLEGADASAPLSDIAAAYDCAGDSYVAYADGDPARPFAFEGTHGFSDRKVWSVLEHKLQGLRTAGRTSVRLLDAGCGPGTWLRRMVIYARQLGFSRITARGFDIAQAQITTARRLAGDLVQQPGVDFRFEVADIDDRFPEADGCVDLTLCLYSVLSHLQMDHLPYIAAELARVTRGHFVTTVRATGGPPTIFIDSIDKARSFRLDRSLDRCEIELVDGRCISLNFHLFRAHELRRYFAPHFQIDDLCGLDIFHHRFAPDQRWNPVSASENADLASRLADLDESYARHPAFMDSATHLLLIGTRLVDVKLGGRNGSSAPLG